MMRSQSVRALIVAGILLAPVLEAHAQAQVASGPNIVGVVPAVSMPAPVPQNASSVIAWASGTNVTADTWTYTLSAPYAGTIDSVTYATGGSSPSFAIAVKIAGTNVTSCNAITVTSSTPATTSCTAANTFTAGQAITLTTSSVSGTPNAAAVQITYHRTGS